MADSKMQKSAVFYGKTDMRMEDLPVPYPCKGEVQIAVACVGICGSDIHLYEDGRLGSIQLSEPLVLGHEFSGTVTAVGENVTQFKIGDRVAVEPAAPCRKCELCTDGMYNLCRNRQCFCGVTCGDHGGLRPLHCHPAEFCAKLPDTLTLEEGMLLEPLAVALHACTLVDIHPGSSVLITGAGPIGISTFLVAKAKGATTICITDILQHRLDFAKSLGATHTLLVKDDDDPEILASKVKAIMGCEADATLECSSAESALSLAILAIKPGRAVAAVGIKDVTQSIPISHAIINEIDIRGSSTYKNNVHTALQLVASGQVDMKPLVTHRFKLDQAVDAFKLATRREGMKVLVQCNDY